MARRKTADERSQDRYEAESRAWDTFRPKLVALTSLREVEQLLRAAPPHSDPGRRFYSNLGFFMQNFDIPAGASDTERALYLEFVRRLDVAGELKPGALEAIERRFRSGVQLL